MDMSEWTYPFFGPTCREVLDSYFQRYGFRPIESAESVRVSYTNSRQSVDFSYWVEDRPRCTVMVGIGEVGIGEAGVISVGEIIEITDPADQYWTWEFRDADGLRDALVRIRDRVLPRYAAPLWQHPDVLHEGIASIRQKQRAAEEAERITKQRELAAIAFHNRDYAKVIRIYQEFPFNALSPADQKRLDLARKYSGK